jgi:putative Holliday junction resolvase
VKHPRVLAVDFGDRRTGLAATDWTGSIVVPLDPVVGLPDHECARAIVTLARERETEQIVVGVPLDEHGERGPRAERTLRFVAVLTTLAAPTPVGTVDESLTTDEAHARLKALGVKAARRKKVADSVAAMIILERHLRG